LIPKSSTFRADTERIPSGITLLDRTLAGGLPRGTFICIDGDIGTGTSTFCIQTVWSRLTRGGMAAYVCLDDPPERVIEHFRSYGLNVDAYIEKNQLLVFDANSLMNSLASAAKGQDQAAEQDNLFKELAARFDSKSSTQLSDHRNLGFPRVSVIDSISAAAPYTNLKSTYVLAHLIADQAKRSMNIAVAVTHTGALEANVFSACSSVADGIIRMEYSLSRGELKRLMRIEKMAFTPIPARPLEYKITSKNGIEILDNQR